MTRGDGRSIRILRLRCSNSLRKQFARRLAQRFSLALGLPSAVRANIPRGGSASAGRPRRFVGLQATDAERARPFLQRVRRQMKKR